ncbi:MAG: hypothetical protein ACFFDH_20890 [Promethearchaeota archaeon]
MDPNRLVRIIAGCLCLIIAILRIVFFFFDLSGAIVYSVIFIDFNEAVNLIEGLLMIIFAFIMTIIITIIAVIVHVVLGILQIALSKFKTVTIICNFFITLNILLSIRAIMIYASVDKFSILLATLFTFYIILFSFCIVSYCKFIKKD